MTAIILTVFSSIIIFIVSLFSPRLGTKVQLRLNRYLSTVRKHTRSKPRPIRWAARKPAEQTHTMLHKSARIGKRTRRKIDEK